MCEIKIVVMRLILMLVTFMKLSVADILICSGSTSSNCVGKQCTVSCSDGNKVVLILSCLVYSYCISRLICSARKEGSVSVTIQTLELRSHPLMLNAGRKLNLHRAFLSVVARII